MAVRRVVWSPSGSRLAVSLTESELYLVDPEGHAAHKKVGKIQMGSPVIFAPDGKRFAWSNEEGTLCISDSDTAEVLREFKEGAGGGGRIAWHPSGKRIAIPGGLDGQTAIRDPATGSILLKIPGFSPGLMWSPDGSRILAAGPAGVEVLRRDAWAGTESVELLADYNAAEPLGLEGTKATDDLADYDGKLVLGALAIGGPKMKVHKACVRRLFETNDAILDVDGVYEIAKELGAKDLGAKQEGD